MTAPARVNAHELGCRLLARVSRGAARAFIVSPVRLHAGLRVLLAGLAVSCASPAVAGIFEVDSPGPTSHQELKLEAKLDRRPGVDRYTLPEVEYKLPLSGNADFAIKASYKSIHPQDGPATSGYSGLEMKSKLRFYRSGGFSMTVEPKLKLATHHGPQALRGADELELPWIVGWDHRGWTFIGEAGYVHAFRPGPDSAYAGVLVKRRITSALKVGAEFVADAPHANVHDLSRSVGVGVEWHFGAGYKLAGGARQTLHHPGSSTSRVYILELEKKW